MRNLSFVNLKAGNNTSTDLIKLATDTVKDKNLINKNEKLILKTNEFKNDSSNLNYENLKDQKISTSSFCDEVISFLI